MILKIRGISNAENLLIDVNRLGHCLTSTIVHLGNSSTLSKMDIEQTFPKINKAGPDVLSLHQSSCSARFSAHHFPTLSPGSPPGEKARNFRTHHHHSVINGGNLSCVKCTTNPTHQRRFCPSIVVHWHCAAQKNILG